MKLRYLFGVAAQCIVMLTATAFAGDNPYNVVPRVTNVMPPLVAGEYGTDVDNQDNAGTNVADNDMDVYTYNTAANHPVEFDIIIPTAQNPATRAATLRMDVYDIDLPDEIDEVYVNGKKVGTLTGATNIWGVNYFDIPIGTLKAGRNRIKILIDLNNGNWATNIDWGIIKFSGAAAQVTITKGWIAPVRQKKGMFINAFAEISGKPAKVEVYQGTTYLFDLTDADGDFTWSGQYQIPVTWTVGWKPNIYIKAKNASGAVVSQWPGVTIQN